LRASEWYFHWLGLRSTTVNNRLRQLTDAVTGYLARHNRVRLALPILGEIALVAAIIGFAAWRLWVPPNLAANLPQESGKYVVGAWNLYKTGHYEVYINHKAYPAMGGLGYGFLIVPSFWLAGEFIGNAIYTQLALAILVCVAMYLAMRLCFGVWPALLAALMPPLYFTFYEYARMLDTSIPSAFFLVTGLLVFLWILRRSSGGLIQWALWGLCAGWATAVRSSNAPMFLALTLALVWLLRPRAGECVRNLMAVTIGAAPLMAPLLWYNHHYCGSWLRDAHAYWQSNPFDNFSRVFGLRCAFGLPDYNREMNDRGNLVFYLRELASQFIPWQDFPATFDAWGRGLIFALSAVMVIGVFFTFRRAAVNPHARHFLWFSVITVGVTLLFYSFCEFRANRYIVPLAPFCAAFVAVGIVDTVRRLWLRKHTATLIPLFILIVAVSYYRLFRSRPTVRGDLFPVGAIVRFIPSNIESNAVIISQIYPPLLELLLVRDTQRQLVPLVSRTAYRVQPRPPRDRSKIPMYITNGYPGDMENGAVDLFEFSALEDPRRIQQFLNENIPVYVIDHSMGLFMNDDLATLNRNFELVWFARLNPSERESFRSLFPVSEGVVVWRLKPRPPGFLPQ
jgi:4-amino-4-deoxy-L-arabinose transferase-like glycosyltransferase